MQDSSIMCNTQKVSMFISSAIQIENILMDGDNHLARVQFSNGKLTNSENVEFQLHKNIYKNNPRKKHQLILSAETDRLTYLGNNFGQSALKCNSLCKYFVGVLNKSTGKMEVHDAQLFNMQPFFPGESVAEEYTNEKQTSYREKVDSLIEAFGTIKQKHALNSRRLNQVGNETLQEAVAKAAENIIDKKGISALANEAIQFESQDMSVFLPPCHADADKPEDVYKFEDIISTTEYQAIKPYCEPLKIHTAEEIHKLAQTGNYSSFVLESLKSVPQDEESRDHKIHCLFYLQILIKLHNLKKREFKHKGSLGSDVADVVKNSLMKNFTVLSYNNGRVQNIIPISMKAKIVAYVIALALHINSFQIDLTYLQQDLKISENRILDIARAMGLKVAKKKVNIPGGVAEDHKMATLSLPLVVQSRVRGRKRKKMT
ncbi:DNA-directed RNA polymerase I subunit RPA49 isoform X2 [Pristis pectinata]|uniref:DNA-directed RNA polymerase I subunit RPA49 isoform X2 n=1 Tax=Pristis pectinata TaxID=685728 RepID=UPI00223C9C63|nr:DNA-directed RNA polymerase I subunit RPA49 isoform X2 [Pristis pectinata]